MKFFAPIVKRYVIFLADASAVKCPVSNEAIVDNSLHGTRQVAQVSSWESMGITDSQE